MLIARPETPTSTLSADAASSVLLGIDARESTPIRDTSSANMMASMESVSCSADANRYSRKRSSEMSTPLVSAHEASKWPSMSTKTTLWAGKSLCASRMVDSSSVDLNPSGLP